MFGFLKKPADTQAEAPASAVSQPSWRERLKAGLARTRAQFGGKLKLVFSRGKVDDELLDDLEALLLTNMPATEDNLKELALQRAVVVKDYLASRKVPSSQLFLGAPKTVESEGKWTPHAELNLSTS